MSTKPVDPYICDNIEGLDKIVLEPLKNRKISSSQATELAKKLLHEFNGSQNDQEKAYIVGKRYLHIILQMFKTSNDLKYMDSRYRQEFKKVQAQVEELKASLEKYYTDMQYLHMAKEVKIHGPTPPTTETIDEKDFFKVTGNFITCKELFNILNKSNFNMLLIDVRPSEEFQSSKIKTDCCINIAEEQITTGLSANTLGQRLSEDLQKYWDKRDTYDLLILLDWNSNAENVCSSKIEILRSIIVDWDFNRNYKRPPVFVSGGFKEFLETYPALVTNAHTYLFRKNDELDELLDLDYVEYPSYKDNSVTSPDETKPTLNESFDVTELINDAKENEESESSSSIDEEITAPKDEPPSFPPRQHQPQPQPNEEEVQNAIAEERMKMLIEARSKKPSSISNSVPIVGPDSGKLQNAEQKGIPHRPTINRTVKPSVLKTTGRTGLRNIRNTCYMNAAFQCFRVLPIIKHMFLTGRYKKYVTTNKPAIIEELARLINDLWHQDYTFISPTELYAKICSLDKMYKLGNHEDSMEFFTFLFSKINEDCMEDMKRTDVLTPKLQAKMVQLMGKTSIFVDLFYHQIRNIRICQNCNNKDFNFEIDNTLMLPVPDRSCSINHLIEDYFKDYTIQDYVCVKCTKCVINRREVTDPPKILICVLKRYSQLYDSGNYIKNETLIYFDQQLQFGQCSYKLYSFAMHQGSLKSGHYTAAGKINNEWYEFNDERVTKMNIYTDYVRVKVCALFYHRDDD